MIVYSVDIGGSYLKHALVETSREGAHITKRFEAIKLASKRLADLRQAIFTSVGIVLTEERSISTIAVSSTGSVNKNGVVINAGHFEDYRDVSWENLLLQEFRQVTRVVTTNDGKASAWAEYVGQGGSSRVFAHFVVGTGIGGGIVINGELVYGDSGYAGYLGHIKVTSETSIACSCKRYGCVETVASASGIIRYFEGKSGHKGANTPCTLDDVIAAANEGQVAAIDAFKSAGRWLGVAISNVMNILNPGVITIGGGVPLAAHSIRGLGQNNIFVTAAVEKAKELAHRRVAAETRIGEARYGNDGGLIGAAMMAVCLP